MGNDTRKRRTRRLTLLAGLGFCMYLLMYWPCQAEERAPVVSGQAAEAALESAQRLVEAGKFDDAVLAYQRALQVFQEQNAPAAQATVMSDMGVLYRRMGAMDRSLVFQQQAMALYEELGDVAGRAISLRRIGVLYRHLGQFEDAITAQEDALALLRSIDDQQGMGTIFTNLGTIYGDLGRLNEAREYFERALRVYAALENRQGLSYTYGNLGQLYLYLGDSRQALHYLDQSLTLKKEAGDRGGQANTLLNLGTVYRNIGNFQQALSLYYQALDAYRGLYDDSGAALALGHLGSVYEELGDLDRAVQLQAEAFELKKTGGTTLQMTVTLTNLASLSMKQQQYAEAAAYLDEGLRLAVKQNGLLAQAHIYGMRGDLLLRQNQHDGAIAAVTKALRLYTQIGSQKGQMEAYESLGRAFERQGAFERAAEYYDLALHLADTLHDQHALWGLQYHLGRLARQRGDSEDALRYFKASVDTLEQMRSYFDVSELRTMFVQNTLDPYIAVIRLLLANQEIREALVYLERLKARTFLEVVDSGNPEFFLGPDLVEQERYLATRIRYLHGRLRAATADGAFIADAGRTDDDQRSVTGRLTHELNDAKAEYEDLLLQIKLTYPEYYRLKIVDAAEIRRLVDQAVTLIEPDVLLVEYFLDEDALHIWSIGHQDINYTAVPVTRAEMLETVLQLRMETGYYFSDRVYPLLHTLYSWCITPIAEHVRGKTTIGIVPFEVLHFVPFGALTSAPWTPAGATAPHQVPPYLIEDYALFSLPSLSVLPVVRERNTTKPEHVEPATASQPAVFGLGNATRNLPGAEREVLELTARFPHSVSYVGEAATKQRLFDEAGQYEIVHLATHGVYDKAHPMFSYLELASDALYAREVFGLRLRADLVTLSGCETFLPQNVEARDLDTLVSGDELVGFLRAFLFAGAPSVLSSLWRVNDEATQRLMDTFYRQLPDAGKAVALQRAAQALMRSTLTVGRRRPRTLALRHPFFWSSFVLIGDWK